MKEPYLSTRDKDSSDASDPERAAGSRVPPQAFVPDEVIEANIARVLRNTPERGEGSGGWVVSVRYLVKALAAARAGSRVPSPPALIGRCTEWLSVGGFFNPEMMGTPQANADATRQLILDVREALRPLEDDARGLSVDMLDVDRLRDWARLLLTHGADVGHWASVPHLASRMQILATNLEKAIRDIGALRAAVVAAQEPDK